MEQKIERTIDNALENIAAQIYILGIILIVLGMAFIMKKSSKKNVKTVGLSCVAIGA